MRNTVPRRFLLPTILLVFAGCLQQGVGPLDMHPVFDALLRQEPYSDLRVRIHYVDGREPDAGALETLRSTLETTLSKRTIRTEVDTSPMERLGTPYNEGHLRHFAQKHLEHQHGSPPPCPVFVVDVFYVNGALHDRDDILGLYAHPSIFIFKDNLHALALQGQTPKGVSDPQTLWVENVERSVLIHEFGHAMGLVNNGVPMVTPREDPEHRHHSRNEESVMYYAVDKYAGVLEYVADNRAAPYRFDPDDLADLRAYQRSRATVTPACP